MKWMNSVRGRLTLVSAIVIAVVLTSAGVAMVLLFESYIERRVAQELHSRLLDLSGAFDLNDEGQPVLTSAPSDPRYRSPYSGAYWYVRQGPKVLWRSRSLWDADIAAPAAIFDKVVRAAGPDGRAVYLLEKHVAFGEGADERTFVLGVAMDQAEVQVLSSSFGMEIATILGLIGVLLFAGAWLQAKYGLKPLLSIRRQLALLRLGERERLDGPFPEEIAELAQDLNTLFAHQKHMILRARERAGALAHGLKTPMTILYGEARKLDLSGRKRTAQSIRSQLDLIHQQIDRELSRARAHGATAGIGLHADIAATAQRLVGLMQRMPRGAEIDWRLPKPGLQVAMDADDFGEVLGNLLDNARKWAKSVVEIDAVDMGDGSVKLSVADDGPGIPDSFRGEAFERGTAIPGQGDGRSADSSGLGLSIVSELVAAYGSDLTLETGPLGGAKVTLRLGGSASVAAH
jgi:signal transduction histidine kinase